MSDITIGDEAASAGPIAVHRRWDAIALGVIAISMLPAGLQAAFAPRSFFDDFPLGRSWIAHDGDAYNEHLVRDVGVLFVALILATGWVVIRRLPTRAIATAWLLQGTLHVAHHARHLGGYDTVDTVGLIGSLVLVPLLAVIALWSAPRGRE